MRERLIIVFIAIAIGLLLTTLLFFLYQQTKITPDKIVSNQPKTNQVKSSENTIPLSVDEPADFSISDRRTIQVKGKTDPTNTVVVSTNQEDVVTTPAADGKFSVSITIDSGVNKIITRAFTSSGEQVTVMRVVTYSTEEF